MNPADRPTWSKTQVASLTECSRKFLFNSRLFAAAADHPAAGAAALKKIKNRHLWAGGIVHETVGEVLKNVRQGSPIPPDDELVARVRERMRAEFKSSRDGASKEST